MPPRARGPISAKKQKGFCTVYVIIYLILLTAIGMILAVRHLSYVSQVYFFLQDDSSTRKHYLII
jgi:hypothetical protein